MKWLRGIIETIRSYHRNVLLFIFANIFIQIGMGMFAVMYNLYIKELGFAEAINGKVIAMTAMATAMMLVPAGFLGDRLGRKWLIFGGALLSVLTLFFRSAVTTEDAIIFTAFLTGLTMAFFQVSGVPLLAENSKPNERVQLFSIHFALMTVSGVVGSLLGGVVADGAKYLFHLTAATSIQWSLFAGSGIFMIGLIPLFFITNQKTEKIGQKTTLKGRLFSVAGKKNLMLIFHFSLASLLIGFGSGLVVPYLNLYFSNRFEATNSYIGFILALGSAMTAVAMMIGPLLVKKIGKVQAIMTFQLLSIPFLLITAFTTSLWIASLGFLMRQALMNAANPIQSAVAMEIVDDQYKGLANSMNQMVFQVGWASMAPLATGLVMTYGNYFGYVYTFGITSVLYVIASTYYFVVFGKRVRN